MSSPFVSPILGIEEIPPFGVEKAPRRKRCHLFLIRRKVEWPQALDSLINKCHHDLEHDVDDDTWFVEEYEKEFIGRLPSGREIHRVKTPEEFDAEVAANKAKTVAAEKKKEDDAAEKAAYNGGVCHCIFVTIYNLSMVRVYAQWIPLPLPCPKPTNRPYEARSRPTASWETTKPAGAHFRSQD